MRLSKEELEKVKDKYGVKRLWSWSKVNTFMTSPYEYLLKYILHTPEDRQDCIYTTTGTIAHDILEKLYTKQIQYADMDEQFEDGWSLAVDVSDLKFDRNDEEHNKKLADKYYDDLKHFYKHHTPIPYKVAVEQFITTKIGDSVLQGYIDIAFKDNEGYYNIIDNKTSSIYKGKSLEEKSGQLCIYAEGVMQKGIPINKIKIGFNFLKYVTVQYQQANGSVKERNIERFEIGDKLQSNVKMWLKKLGYEDKIDEYLKDLVDYNDIAVLPKDVQAKYKIADCYVFVPLTQELIDKWNDTIITTIKDIELREEDYKKDQNDKWFWDTEENVKKESYYFATLCAYSGRIHKPYGQYLDKLETEKEGFDLFRGIGNDMKETCTTNVQVDKPKTQNNMDDTQNIMDDDLDWLNEIVI